MGYKASRKENFWQAMDEKMQEIPRSEDIAIEGDMNGHMSKDEKYYDWVHAGHGFRERNKNWERKFLILY